MTRDLVLSILKTRKGYVSGELISKELGLTRAAVSLAVKALRKDGYVILSSTKKGYLMKSAPDCLTSGELLTILGPERMRTVSVFDTVQSTNRVLSELAYDDPKDGQVVIADAQTGGRGRFGRSFYSPEKCGIYLSCLFRPETPPSSSIPITAWTAVAVSRAVETVCGVQPGIKWVNVLILSGKKFGGILTEMSIEGESGRIRQTTSLKTPPHPSSRKRDQHFPARSSPVQSSGNSISSERHGRTDRLNISGNTAPAILRPIIRSSSWTGPAEPRQQRASAMTFHSIYAIRTDRLKSSQAVRSASVLSKNRKKQTEPHRRDSRPAKKDHCTWPASQRMSVMYSGLSFYGDRSLCGHRDNKPFHIVPGDCIGSRWLCDRPLCRIVDLEGPGVPFDDKG